MINQGNTAFTHIFIQR